MHRRRVAVAVGLVATTFLAAGPASTEPDFATWLDEVRREASARGVSASTLDAALTGVAPIPRVIELDRRQPEATLSVERYLAHVVTPARIQRGRAHLHEHRTLLDEIGGRYGVPPALVVALWGIETNYGRVTGDFPVVGALATLAHDGRRRALFREELFAALRILDEGHIGPEEMRGSWAGAMGQSQFMPTSFLGYAVDADGDGRRDIWTSVPDVFASIANYLARAGWRAAEPWGQRVRLPTGFDGALAGVGVEKPVGEWRRLGLRRADGRELQRAELPASLVLPRGPSRLAFLVHENARVLMRWNRSLAFVLAVGHLADTIRAAPVSSARPGTLGAAR